MIRENGGRFLVAGRLTRGQFVTADQCDIPESYRDLFIPIPAFRVDLSSSDIRDGKAPSEL